MTMPRIQKRHWRAVAMFAVWLFVLPSLDSLAADTKQADRERAALSRAQEALRKVEREKSSLLQEKTSLMEEKKNLQEEQSKAGAAVQEAQRRALATQRSLAAMRKTADDKDKELELLRKDKAQLTASIESLRAQVEKLTLERTAALTTTQTRDVDLGKVRAVAQARARVLAACEEKNDKLYQVGVDLIERFENRGFWDSVTKAEPFTRQKRVDLENLMESYRDKLKADRITALPAQ